MGAPAAGPADRRGVPLLPFLWFLWRGWIEPGLRARLWAIFGLGALQGAIGWWMVASGLSERVAVSQYRLATHMTLACVIFAACFGPRSGSRAARSEPAAAFARGDRAARSWCWTPANLSRRAGRGPARRPDLQHLAADRRQLSSRTARGCSSSRRRWRNFFENALTVQFDHRMVAYVLWAFALIHVIDVADRAPWPAHRGAGARRVCDPLRRRWAA